MKLEVSEAYTVSGMKDPFPTLAAAMAAIDKAGKPGSFTVTHAMAVVASGAGIVPGAPATGAPVAKSAAAK
jgi:hypothetical protein